MFKDARKALLPYWQASDSLRVSHERFVFLGYSFAKEKRHIKPLTW